MRSCNMRLVQRSLTGEEQPMKKDNEQEKKAYEKPVLKRFPLRPEEAVLGFCKSSASSGPSGGGCRGVSTCFSPGS